ncbi:hypothetical protein [Methylomicrobium sp. Wu6]|uniref:hypothetical protein n=1 Tax=Methylomicrobium sp. Wu6 TaxID=3107928 RepID=UPI002DD63271|nr:hypothetical protein [Methylomicrobium sp. Wu6]MEC4747724.1 hypothetical protein [Methylomicrobium sp. Wu6]
MLDILSNSNSEFLKIVKSSTARKARTDKWMNYYHDQQSEEMLRLIKQRWSRPETFRVFQVNAVKKVINKRANLYRLAPRRTFTGINQVLAEEFYKAAGVDIVLKRLSRLTKLLKTSVLQVCWMNDQLTLSVITPNILDVEYDNPLFPKRFVITHKAAKEQDVTYSDWTAGTYTRRDYRGNPMKMGSNPKGVNPYGALPFVCLFDSLPDDQFFIPGGDDLIEAQEAINVALSNLWRAVELQAHGQAWASGIPAGEALNVGPERAVTLPEGGAFGFAAPNAPIGDILEAIQFVLRQVAASNDLSADVFDLDRRSESGAAKHVEQIDLREARQDDIALWRRYETQLFEIIKRVVNTHQPGTIPEDARVTVDFAEMQENLTETERLNNARAKLEMGVWSPVDLLISENPDGYPTRQDAIQELLRRKDESTQITLVD